MRPHPRWLQNQARLMALAALILAFPYHSSAQTSDTPSLGDVARKQRDKQPNAKKAKAKKVVTEEDIPSHPDPSASDEEVPPSHSEKPATPSANDVLKTGDQWKASIAQQKAAVANLKSRIDKLNASIRFVSASAYTNGVEYNKMQARRQQEAQRLQDELDEQKKNLEQMQETARRAGYGSAVWDP
jgi:hypothetical protein